MHPLRRLAVAVLVACAVPLAAHAQSPVRAIPDEVELGRLEIGVFPQAVLDGRPVVLGPGTRIFDQQNLIRPPSTVQGVQRVAFARGTMGEITRVWLLSDTEFREISARLAAARRAAQQR